MYQRKKRADKIKQERRNNMNTNLRDQRLNSNQTYAMAVVEFPGLKEITECQICLTEFTEKDLISLTVCAHLFHLSCIKLWLRRNKVCMALW